MVDRSSFKTNDIYNWYQQQWNKINKTKTLGDEERAKKQAVRDAKEMLGKVQSDIRMYYNHNKDAHAEALKPQMDDLQKLVKDSAWF